MVALGIVLVAVELWQLGFGGDELWAIAQSHIVCTSTLATRDPELIGRGPAAGRLSGDRHRL